MPWSIDRALSLRHAPHGRRRAGSVEDTPRTSCRRRSSRRERPCSASRRSFEAGGQLVYEINVRSFHHAASGGTGGNCAALSCPAQPAVIDASQEAWASAVELMPITAWMDERHLPPLGLRNAGATTRSRFMALDPRLVPGRHGSELARHGRGAAEAGIGVDPRPRLQPLRPRATCHGPTVVAARARQRSPTIATMAGSARLVNDTGTGNTVACEHPVVHANWSLDSLRAFRPLCRRRWLPLRPRDDPRPRRRTVFPPRRAACLRKNLLPIRS
jgi:glycogen operon protein